MVGIFALVTGFIWTMLLSHGHQVIITFGEIKQGWHARKFRELSPILLGTAGLFITAFGVGFVMLAFDVPLLVGLAWLAACVYAVVQTVRGFRRAR